MKKLLYLIIFFSTYSFSVFAQNESDLVNTDTVPAQYVGGEKELYKFLRKNTKYSPEVIDNEVKGKVVIGFTITEHGKVENAFVKEKLEPYCDFEALRVVNSMPAWQPARINNKAIESINELYVSFFDNVEYTRPEFVDGGEKGLLKFISNTIKYPKEALKKGIAGRVVAQFEVQEDGQIADMKIVEKIHPLLDEEAVRIVNEMPKWKAGAINGKPVSMYFTIPIIFNLSKNKKGASSRYVKISGSDNTLYILEGKVVHLKNARSIPEETLKHSVKINNLEKVPAEYQEFADLAKELGKKKVIILESKADAIQRKIRR